MGQTNVIDLISPNQYPTLAVDMFSFYLRPDCVASGRSCSVYGRPYIFLP